MLSSRSVLASSVSPSSRWAYAFVASASAAPCSCPSRRCASSDSAASSRASPGRPGDALLLAAESLEAQRRLGHEQGAALAEATKAYAHLLLGETELARTLLLDSMRSAQRVGYRHGVVFCL